jgi:hypothetical protein
MNTKFLHVLALLLLFQSASSQTVVSRLTDFRKFIWDDDKEEFIREPLKQDFKSPNPKAILAFDEITIIDKDTSSIYLNSYVQEEDDSTVITKIWEEAIHDGLECSVILFFYKQENYYSIRIIYDDYTGIEYFLNPLKVDAIPYKFEKS